MVTALLLRRAETLVEDSLYPAYYGWLDGWL
jgi:hypothetical protein